MHGVNYLDVVSLTGTVLQSPTGPSNDPNVFQNTRQIEVGMVLTHDPSGNQISDNRPMVSKIIKGAGSLGGDRIFFKNYAGGNSLTASGASGSLPTGTTTRGAPVVYTKSPINGLRHNSVSYMHLNLPTRPTV